MRSINLFAVAAIVAAVAFSMLPKACATQVAWNAVSDFKHSTGYQSGTNWRVDATSAVGYAGQGPGPLYAQGYSGTTVGEQVCAR